ncbi:hypothetical protein LMH87_010029 [Akanthomyces muscarius]|uniref:Uncharacterized protein n=1 Tax=Akanthomyces muscarius TaxID=2231603 RepID=A0A9W8QCI0_AKAMU|nr:hypothetical protein LMH87_010029 [Akanthomyces muscarius]KAJ4153545.1 hypothetical protein LMH87_010029 [Akanthomyces muscarius]
MQASRCPDWPGLKFAAPFQIPSAVISGRGSSSSPKFRLYQSPASALGSKSNRSHPQFHRTPFLPHE